MTNKNEKVRKVSFKVEKMKKNFETIKIQKEFENGKEMIKNIFDKSKRY